MISKILLSLIPILEIVKCSSEFKVIELDYGLGPETPYFVNPSSQRFTYEIIEAGNSRGFWLALGKYLAVVHMGTHVAAPYTHNADGFTIDQIPVEQFFGEAAVIDIKDKVANNGNYELTESDITDWIAKYGVFPNNSFILINTGWDVGRYPDQLAFFGNDKAVTNLKFPGVRIDAMRAILNFEKTHGINIRSVGIDTPRLDYGPATTTRPSSGLLASLNKFEIRDLRDLSRLPALGARLIVTPLNIKNASGAPTRVLAILP